MARLPFPRGGIRTRLPLTIYRRSSADEFSPTEIEGLALWLDASSSDSLYTTDAGPVSAVASPLDIAGCTLWLDANDPASITASGSEVTAWADKSATGSTWTIPSGFGGPTTGSTTLGGKNALLFDGVNDVLKSSNNPLGTALPLTFFIVQRIIAPTNFGTSYVIVPSTKLIIRQVSTFGWVDGFVGGLSDATNRLFRDDRNRTGLTDICTIVFPSGAGTTNTAVVNGAGLATTNSTLKPDVQGDHYIGCRLAFDTTPEQFANIAVAEIIAFNTALTTAQRASVEAYLAQRWGISGVHAPATASSDPVGYWRDKSGNNRHLTQTTANLRGLVFTSSGRTRVDIPATLNSGFSSASPTTSSSGTVIQAGRFAGNSGWLTILRGDGSAFVDAASSGSGASPYDGAGTPSFFVQGAPVAATRGTLYSGLNDKNAVFSATNINFSTWSSGWRYYNFGSSFQFIGEMGEVLVYNRALTTAERQRAERYLSARWGITLAPQVSNLDAQDWINRVYANGGTVSSATAASVNTLCESLESASLRDRFFRLNLFCGNSDASLAAVRTPLFRGPSLGGTQYGNTTDTNNNFLAADYSEASGLQGNGSTKYLNTGVPMNFANLRDYHLSSYVSSITSGNAGFIGADTNGDGVPPRAFQALVSFASGTRIWVWYNIATTFREATNNSNSYTPGLLTGTGSATANDLYVGSSSVASVGAGSNETISQTFPIYVFAHNGRNASVLTYANARLGGYSLGLTMTAAQVGQYNTALAAFNSAMGRA